MHFLLDFQEKYIFDCRVQAFRGVQSSKNFGFSAPEFRSKNLKKNKIEVFGPLKYFVQSETFKNRKKNVIMAWLVNVLSVPIFA